MPNRLKDLTGKRFGHWKVLERDGKIYPTRWICKCDCGTVKSVSLWSLSHGSTSCEQCRSGKKISHFVHVHKNKLYHTWSDMRLRCQGRCTQHKYYGDKGIGMCKDWEDFDVFAHWAVENGYRPDLEIDRIDSDKEYSPDNCRWVTHKMNSRNRKARSNNTTGVAGVYVRKLKNGGVSYRVSIATDNGKINLGSYSSIEKAAEVRREAELKYWGFNIGE